MSSAATDAIAMRRSIRRCNVPGLYSVKSWAVLVRNRSRTSGSQIGAPCAPASRRASAILRPKVTSASAMLAAGRTRSTAPAIMALRGMPSWTASSGSCTMTRPHSCLMAFDPTLPSAPVPERITQTDRAPHAAANEFSRKSNGRRAPRRAGGLERRRTPPSTDR